jgi:hypothetical protein
MNFIYQNLDFIMGGILIFFSIMGLSILFNILLDKNDKSGFR